MPKGKAELIIKNAEQIRRKFQDLGPEWRKEIAKALFRGGVIIQRRAQEILREKGHIVTGNLFNNIRTSEVEGDGIDMAVNIGSDVSYAIYVELLPDGGYLVPAFREKAPEVVNFLRRENIAFTVRKNREEPG